jgi:hypothetical protein
MWHVPAVYYDLTNQNESARRSPRSASPSINHHHLTFLPLRIIFIVNYGCMSPFVCPIDV